MNADRTGRFICVHLRSSAAKFLRSIVEKSSQAVTAAGMAQFAQGLGFDLADALAGDGEVLADLLECVLAAVVEAEPHLDDLLLARRESLQDLRRLLAQIQIDHGFRRR